MLTQAAMSQKPKTMVDAVKVSGSGTKSKLDNGVQYANERKSQPKANKNERSDNRNALAKNNGTLKPKRAIEAMVGEDTAINNTAQLIRYANKNRKRMLAATLLAEVQENGTLKISRNPPHSVFKPISKVTHEKPKRDLLKKEYNNTVETNIFERTEAKISEPVINPILEMGIHLQNKLDQNRDLLYKLNYLLFYKQNRSKVEDLVTEPNCSNDKKIEEKGNQNNDLNDVKLNDGEKAAQKKNKKKTKKKKKHNKNF